MTRASRLFCLVVAITLAAACKSDEPSTSKHPSVRVLRWRVEVAGGLAPQEVASESGLTADDPVYGLYGEVPLGTIASTPLLAGIGAGISPYPSPFIGALHPGAYADRFEWRNTALSSLSKPLSAYLANGGPAVGTYFAFTSWGRGCLPIVRTCEDELGTEASGWILVKLEDVVSMADPKTREMVEGIDDLMDRMKAAALALAATWEAGVPYDAGAPPPDATRDANTQPHPDGDPPPTIDGGSDP